MSNLTTAQRNKLPDSAFAGPNRTFPIVDAADVMSAAMLLGKASNPAAVKRRVILLARAKGLKLPDAWEADMGKGKAAASAALKSAVRGMK